MNYFYLADGTKTRALDGSGEGLVYRGPFVYRKGSGSSSLTLESAVFGGGRLTPDGALLYMTDYLGSVRAVVDGTTGQIYKAVDYSAYGYESEVMVPQQGSTPEHTLAAATLPSGMTLRDSFTGQEDQTPDFGTSYTDFGARQYSPALRRWMTPDPMSEKYYGMSPYVFCADNPVNFVDPDGRFPEVIWDVASIGMGVKSLIGNIKAGETRAAIGDGIGIVVDVAAAALPFVPGGVGAVRAGAKTVDALDNVAEAAKVAASISDGARAVDGIKFKSFTRGNFRDNLGRLTGAIPDGMQAHHTLPCAFEKRFSDIGINIHDPKYGVWLDSKQHNKLSHKYNAEWEKFFKTNPSYTEEQVMEYEKKLMNEIYGQ